MTGSRKERLEAWGCKQKNGGIKKIDEIGELAARSPERLGIELVICEGGIPLETVTLGRTGITTCKNGFGALPIQRIDSNEASALLIKAYEEWH